MYDEITMLNLSEQANSDLEESDVMKIIVYDSKDEEALVQAMPIVDSCLLISPARYVFSLSLERQRPIDLCCNITIIGTTLEAAKTAKTLSSLQRGR